LPFIVTMNHLRPAIAGLLLALAAPAGAAADGVFVRLRLVEPAGTRYHVVLGGYIHNDPWYLPNAVLPAGADRDADRRLPAGSWTAWFDLKAHAGGRLHGRLARAGGVAEFPNVTAEFAGGDPAARRTVEIELATAADEARVVKRWRESFTGSLTSFLVSPDLARDAAGLETAAEMTARRLAWARAASGGTAVTPNRLIVQTSFWAPQRLELNVQEAEVLRLLGFNTVGNQTPEVRTQSRFRRPGATHDVDFGPRATREDIERHVQRRAGGWTDGLTPGAPFNFSDEVTAGSIGTDRQALAHFHAWLGRQDVAPGDLGVSDLRDVVPIETPEALRERQRHDRRAANRVFYFTSRFRQAATTERLRWLTEAVHRHAGAGPLTSVLVADHPYFSGTGLGMGMGPNPAWGRPALAADWFDLARCRAVDLAGVEDWLGLQYMYGPNFTWEGFQLLGFQAAMFRSGGRGRVPVIAWVTPSDETNLRLKAGSALCQGARHFYFWTYGPTATSTENYWSDLRGAYDGVVRVTRQLAAAEHVIAPGTTRPTRVALLYSISSDLWQPFGYVHMLERRGTYLALVHEQYLVDLLTEEDVTAGRLDDYDVLYVTDPCIQVAAAGRIADWVRGGGHLYGTTAAGSRNEFDEEVDVLAAVFGVAPRPRVQAQPADYHIRGALNGVPYLDQITPQWPDAAADRPETVGVIGAKVALTPTTGTAAGTFGDGTAAVVRHTYGRGRAVVIGACPGVAYVKEAKFVPRELKEQWPGPLRRFITAAARERGAPRLVDLSHPVVEAGVFDADAGTALALANFTYQPIDALTVRLPLSRPAAKVRSAEQGALPFTSERAAEGRHPPGYPWVVRFTLRLGLNDVVVVE
jgi:hypothetical protein